MGIFGSKPKKSLIDQSTDVISSFTTIVTNLTGLNKELQKSKDAKDKQILELKHAAAAEAMQRARNVSVIDKINDIIGNPVDKKDS